MGNDNTVCNAARVSTGNHKVGYKESAGLINYLWREGHTSCFEHCAMTVHVKVPIFIARQIQRHRVFSYNEISGRYSELDLEFYVPSPERPLTNNGSGAYPDLVSTEDQEEKYKILHGYLQENQQFIKKCYKDMLDRGVATEIARSVLPLNTYTEFYMTGNLKNWLDFVSKRTVPNAQEEVRFVAEAVAKMIEDNYPLVWKAYKNNG